MTYLSSTKTDVLKAKIAELIDAIKANESKDVYAKIEAMLEDKPIISIREIAQSPNTSNSSRAQMSALEKRFDRFIEIVIKGELETAKECEEILSSLVEQVDQILKATSGKDQKLFKRAFKLSNKVNDLLCALKINGFDELWYRAKLIRNYLIGEDPLSKELADRFFSNNK